jgi:transcriptional regulator with XRE-family HTH domain
LTESQGAFCARLKAAREAKGVTIDQIAASTKIPASLLQGLEHGDVSRWPAGLYRRAYLRDYLRMIGLPPDPHVAEFRRLFPHRDDDTPVLGCMQPIEHQPTPFSMMLAEDRPRRAARVSARLAAASIDAALVVGASMAVVVALRLDAGMVLGGVAVAYHAVAAIVLGRTVGARLTVDRRVVTRWKRRGERPAPAENPPPETLPAPAGDPPPEALPSASTA